MHSKWKTDQWILTEDKMFIDDFRIKNQLSKELLKCSPLIQICICVRTDFIHNT